MFSIQFTETERDAIQIMMDVNKNKSVYINVSSQDLRSYPKFRKSELNDQQSNDYNVYLNNLVISIWNKSKVQLFEKLSLEGNLEDILHEEENFETAGQYERFLTGGKMFTRRQLQILSNISNIFVSGINSEENKSR